MIKRREFMTLLGGAAAWPLVARAQHAGKLPTIGYLGATSPSAESQRIAAFLKRLREPDRADALYLCPDALLNTNRIRINILAVGARLPTMHGHREYVEAGGLMSYGPNLANQFPRVADFVDKILRGAKPADIPVEQPTNFQLIVNLTTAKALRLDVPATLLARADDSSPY
jgi:putative ABC transport system substrate-binding protein